jgi:hypothetical protein
MHESGWLGDHPEADFVLVGEYEHTLRELPRRLDTAEAVDGVAGLIRRDADGGGGRSIGRWCCTWGWSAPKVPATEGAQFFFASQETTRLTI